MVFLRHNGILSLRNVLLFTMLNILCVELRKSPFAEVVPMQLDFHAYDSLEFHVRLSGLKAINRLRPLKGDKHRSDPKTRL